MRLLWRGFWSGTGPSTAPAGMAASDSFAGRATSRPCCDEGTEPQTAEHAHQHKSRPKFDPCRPPSAPCPTPPFAPRPRGSGVQQLFHALLHRCPPFDEIADSLVARGSKLVDRAVADDPAAVNHGQAVADLECAFHVVSDDDAGDLELFL